MIGVGDFLGNRGTQAALYDHSAGPINVIAFDNKGTVNLNVANSRIGAVWGAMVAGNFLGTIYTWVWQSTESSGDGGDDGDGGDGGA